MKKRLLNLPRWSHFFLKRFTAQTHFLIMLLFVNLFGSLQAVFFSRAENPWLHLDLVSVLIVYFSVEHFLLGAFVRVLYAAMFMHSLSLAPAGFYLMYFLLALVLSSLVSRVIVLHNILSQLFIFSIIFLLKFVLLFFVLQKSFPTLAIGAFVLKAIPEILGTTMVSVPVFSLLAYIDSQFEYVAFRDQRKERSENLT
jgi:hypothetical protein